MLTLLESLLTRILDQQKYAEAKNAAVATISGACGAALLTAYSIRSAQPSGGLAILNLGAAAFFFLAVIFAVLALLPQLNNRTTEKRPPKPDANLFFFEHLKDFTEAQLLDEFSKIPGVASSHRRIETDLANQIIVNSNIVSRKHVSFCRAALFLLLGLFALLCIFALEITSNSGGKEQNSNASQPVRPGQ